MSTNIERYLVARYGPAVLEVERRYVPPRRAKPRHRLAVIPKPGQRAKLVAEVRREGFKANLTRHRITKEITANLVFTNALPAFAKHARDVLAEIPSRDLVSLYGERPLPVLEEKPYEKGDRVRIKAGPFAARTGELDKRKSKAAWLVNIGSMRTVVQIHNMVRIDPG